MRDDVARAYAQAVTHLRDQQLDNGAFAGECVWNPMLVCQYVIVCHVTGREIPDARRRRVRLSLEQQVLPDGGWGMHVDSDAYLFHTTLAYVTLRLVGHGPDDPLVAGAARWIERHGGVYALPSWGRTWLAILGLYPWDAIQPILPELWLLPEASPMHPRRLYCHMRLIYLGMSYLYGARFVAPPSDVVEAIRSELYPEGYDPGRFEAHRHEIAKTDLFEAPNLGLRAAFGALRALERVSGPSLRDRALAAAMERIKFEFRSTGWVCLSPVNGQLFCLALFASDPQHPDLDAAMAGIEYWFWEDDDEGLRIAGARSDIWDTSFVLQALAEGPDLDEVHSIVARASTWLPTAQIQEEIVDGARHDRSPAYGGWGFANEHHPWPVSDCTAEALEALMRVEKAGLAPDSARLHLGRKLAALEFILLRQNDDGGFGSYEPRRGSMLLRHFNPAEIYGNCMVEYSYTECTASCVRGLAWAARELGSDVPPDSARRIQDAVTRGVEFLLREQHTTGGWLGFWGINLTYGTFFAVSGLLAAGTAPTHPAIGRACRYLIKIQRPDGGWGESYRGMLEDAPVPLPPDEPSLVVQTAWAVLTLLAAAPHERDAIDRGIGFIVGHQTDEGGWPPEKATGVFFNTAVLDYRLYKLQFPLWALARYLDTYAD